MAKLSNMNKRKSDRAKSTKEAKKGKKNAKKGAKTAGKKRRKTKSHDDSQNEISDDQIADFAIEGSLSK